jgi:hypothetical protein
MSAARAATARRLCQGRWPASTVTCPTSPSRSVQVRVSHGGDPALLLQTLVFVMLRFQQQTQFTSLCTSVTLSSTIAFSRRRGTLDDTIRYNLSAPGISRSITNFGMVGQYRGPLTIPTD